eukprot:COSAG01_NODE_467_length_16597_cov_10.933446_1_plen_118_part_00
MCAHTACAPSGPAAATLEPWLPQNPLQTFSHPPLLLLRCWAGNHFGSANCTRNSCGVVNLTEIGDAMVANGLRAAGYEYVNLGESQFCWQPHVHAPGRVLGPGSAVLAAAANGAVGF